MGPPALESRVTEFDYKKLLNWLNDSIRSSELDDLKFLLDVPNGESESLKTSFKLFNYMEGNGGLSPSNTKLLIELLNEIGRKDLTKAVMAFDSKRYSPAQSENVDSTILKKPSDFAVEPSEQKEGKQKKKQLKEVTEDPPSYKEIFPSESECDDNIMTLFASNDYSMTERISPLLPPQAPLSSDIHDTTEYATPHTTGYQPIPNYKMSTEPRGKCIIISNADFSQARDDHKPLKDRPGTLKDLHNLTETFIRLKFEVDTFTNLRASEMYKVLNNYAMNIDHSQYDCFACCILTHGNDSGLYGVDGLDLKICNITMLFEPVGSLSGKPKIFFFQACRGVAETRPYRKDAVEDDDDMTSLLRQYATSPLGSDFFIGYATPPGFAAWIGEEGSWYISALCEALNKYSDRYDLQHISTQINDIVSRYSTHQGDKQIPNPTYTLRKILYFFPEKVMNVNQVNSQLERLAMLEKALIDDSNDSFE